MTATENPNDRSPVVRRVAERRAFGPHLPMLAQASQSIAPVLPLGALTVAIYIVYSYLADDPRTRVRPYLFEAFIVVGVTLGLYAVATHLYRDQPPGEAPRHVVASLLRDTGNSFPSHHAIVIALIAAMVALVSVRLVPVFCVLAVVEDLTLVAGSYHTVADVTAGTLIVWLPAACVLAGRAWLHHRMHRVPDGRMPPLRRDRRRPVPLNDREGY